ncbi:MAG: TraC family protein [Bdellovibrionales bacterium]|nr:TraC family protein [Bdellovibrionales bacterium]
MKTDHALSEELPYWEFFSEPVSHAVLTNGDLVRGATVSLRDIECLDDSEVNSFTELLRGALNSLNEGVRVQFCLSVDSNFSESIDKHQNLKANELPKIVGEISKQRLGELENAQTSGELYRPKLVVFLQMPMLTPRRQGFFKRAEEFESVTEAVYTESLEALNENFESLMSGLRSCGLECAVLSDREFKTHVYDFLNPTRKSHSPTPLVVTPSDQELPAKIVEESPWLAPQSPREQLAFGDLSLEPTQFVLDGFAHRVISLKTLPETTSAGQLSAFLRLPFHYSMTLSFEVPPQSAEMAKLQQRRKMAHSLATTHGANASDLESESKLSATEELIRELLNSGQRIFATQITVLLKAPASEDGARILNRHTREVLSRFRMLQGAEGLEETVGAWKVQKTSLPGAVLTLERGRKMKTNNLADFLPVYGPREGDLVPAVIFRNRMGGLVRFNPFDPGLPNYNALVTGSSGAGKSFLNNCILLQELQQNLRVFIIDIGGSYKKLTETLNGQYLEMNLSNGYKINPFDIPEPSKEPSTQKLKSLLASIECMVSDDDGAKLPKLDRVMLEQALLELYDLFRKKGKVPTLSALQSHLASSKEASLQRISKMLYSWTGDRPYGRLLDGEGSLRTDARVCTFDLKGLSSYPDLQSVMTLMLTEFILTQVEMDKTSNKRIILDEAWELLKSPAAASFMEYCARTLRKTGSGITFITQGLEEIVASPIGPAILNNTATKFVMLQRGDSKVLTATLKLNPQELALIHSLEQRKGKFSEGFMIEGNHRQVIRVHPTPLEYWMATSDAKDNAELLRLQKSGLSLEESIFEAANSHPKGMASS